MTEQKGFTIKCNKCGKEKVIQNSNFLNESIEIFPSDYDGEISITCECGNEEIN